jgi:serine/threonine-protein kinase
MADVWAADHQDLGREVAIKVIKPELCEAPDSVERFLTEARTVSRISHPYIVEVFDLGKLPDGRPFMVMPRLLGQSLEELRERVGRLPLREVVLLMGGIAQAIDTLHESGVIHRDIKPDNLFSSVADDGTERVILIDFGLARTLQGDKVTAENTLLGTPHYMPPELVTYGWTKAGDVYSFAVVLCELYTGRLPFDHGTPMELMQRKMYNDAPLVSELVADRVPALVNELFRQSLSRNPDERPKTCGDLLGALRMLSHIRVTPMGGVRRSDAPPQSKTG